MLLSHACMTFRMSPKKIDGYFNHQKVPVLQSSYKIDHREINYICTGDKNNPLILFIHGSPGSLSAFIEFLADSTLLDNYLLISTDRPGFGYSNFGYGEPSMKKQSEMLIHIVEKFKKDKPVILVGHSLAAAIIGQMAMDHPELIDGLVIIAGSIDPDLEPNEAWFRVPLSTPFLSWLLPRSFRASNEELYNFKSELIKMKPYWNEIKVPVVVVQGGKDTFVDPGNADFAKKMIINAPVKIIYKKDMNHFVPWTDPDLVVKGIINVSQMADSLKENSPDNIIAPTPTE